MVADASGRAIGFALAPGQAHELPLAPLLLTLLSLVPGWIVADRGYASQAFRDLIWSLGARPAIPSKSNEAPVHCPAWIYVNRNGGVAEVVEKRGGVVSGLFNEPQPALERRRRPRHGTG